MTRLAPSTHTSFQALCDFFSWIPDDLNRIRRIVKSAEEWQSIFDLASHHGVRQLLYHFVASEKVRLPDDLASQLGRELFLQKVARDIQYDSLLRVLDTLNSGGIQAVALKGPIFAERFYPHRSLRLSTDLDVLVSPTRLTDAQRLLREIGYRSVESATELYNRRYLHHVSMFGSHPGQYLELHFRAHSGFSTEIPADPLIERSTLQTLSDGSEVRVLSSEDELLFLVVHAVGDIFVQVKPLFDLKLLLRANPSFRWEVVVERAGSWHLTSALLIGLKDLSQLLGVAIPAVALSRPPSAAGAVLNVVRKIIALGHPRRPTATLASVVGQAVLCDGLAKSVRCLHHHSDHILRRRLARFAPTIVPTEWQG